MAIKNIESLTYEEAKEIAIEEMDIKGHQIIFTDFGDAFGYSVLVFKDGHHIHYANDYELHHHYLVSQKGREALRAYYVNELNHKLFTDEELCGPITSYDEYQKKDYFLRNYRVMRYDYLSAFCIGNKQEKELDRRRKDYPFYNPVSFCYMRDEEPVSESVKIRQHLNDAFKQLKENEDTFREMIRIELANHEVCVTCDYTATLTALGLKFDELSDVQKRIVKEELYKQTNRYDYA